MALPVAALFFRAISSMVSWRNLASSSLTRSSFFSLSSCGAEMGAILCPAPPRRAGLERPFHLLPPTVLPRAGLQGPHSDGHVCPQDLADRNRRARTAGGWPASHPTNGPSPA